MMANVESSAVASHRETVEELAAPLTRIRRAKPGSSLMPELDDLVQEGMIAVWLILGRGLTLQTNLEVIVHRMRDWVKFLTATRNVEYDQILPLDDYRDV